MMEILLYGLVIILSLYLLPRLLRWRRYRRSSHYQITKRPYSDLDQGEFGEYLIYKALKTFERQGGRFLFNLKMGCLIVIVDPFMLQIEKWQYYPQETFTHVEERGNRFGL